MAGAEDGQAAQEGGGQTAGGWQGEKRRREGLAAVGASLSSRKVAITYSSTFAVPSA